MTISRYCMLWRVTRRDGEVFGFTDHDRDIVYDGLRYFAWAGFATSEIQSTAALNVDNLDLGGFFDHEAISQADLEAGVWDGSLLRVVEYDWTAQAFVRTLRVGELGNFTAKDGLYTAEFRGLMDKLQKQVTRVYLPSCDADLGDTRCKVDLEALREAGTVTAATDRYGFTDSALGAGSPVTPAGYFDYGVVTWVTGANAGRTMEIKRHESGGVITLQLPMSGAIAVGDTYTIVPGCGKRLEEDCRDKYDNIINFRGFPHVPGLDDVLRPGGV